MAEQKHHDVTFTFAQLDLIKGFFPHVAHGAEVSTEKLRHYNGQQSVVIFIEERTRGMQAAPRRANGQDIPTPGR